MVGPKAAKTPQNKNVSVLGIKPEQEPKTMKKTVLAFSRVTPPMIERLQQEFDVIVPNPKG
jgi:gluconate 2-dehydrogenase